MAGLQRSPIPPLPQRGEAGGAHGACTDDAVSNRATVLVMRTCPLVLMAFAVAGCAHAPGRLVAPSGEQRLIVRDAPTGVTLVVTTGAWQGRPSDLEDELTVMHILVTNGGDEPVLLAPGDLELADRRGFRYALLDPGATFRRATASEISAKRYDLEYADTYDRGGPGEGQRFAPGGDLAPAALPWGVLEPGTQMRGFVYFEPMTQNANAAQLTWHLGTPNHRPLVDTVFEFAVTDAG